MIRRRLISSVVCLALALLFLAPVACGPAPSAPTQSVQPPPRSVPALPAKALVKLDDLPPPLERPQSKPYLRRLPAGALQAMREARALQAKKNYAAAVEKLQRARDFDPENPRIRQLLGIAYLSLPNYGEALKNLEAANEYLADNVQMQILLGRMHQSLRNADKAILHFRTALLCSNAKPSNPKAAYVLLALARMLEKQGYWTAALECLDTFKRWSREHGRAYESHALLESLIFRPEELKAMRGHLLAKLQRTDEAIPLLTNAYHRNRSDAQTASWLFEALIQARRFAQAESLLVEMGGAGPLKGLAPSLAKALCEASGDNAMPLRLWQSLRKDEKMSAPLAIRLARLARENGTPASAAKILDDLLKEVPHHTEAVQLLAELSLETGNPRKAMDLLADLIQANPQSPDAVAAGVRAIAKAQTEPDLLQTFSETTYQDTSDKKFALHYVAGLLALEYDKPLKAADHFQRAIRAKKDFYPAYDAMLDLHLRAKDTEALQVLLDLCKEVAEEGYYYNYLLGRARLSEGKPDQAIDALEAARKKNSSHRPTRMTLAKAYRRQAQQARDTEVRKMFQKQAQEVLRRAIQLAPDQTDAYRALFDLYLQQRATGKALEVAQALRHRQPNRPDGALMQAEAFLRLGQIKKARIVLAKLARAFPKNPSVQLLAIQAILGRFPGVLPRPVFDQAADRLRTLLRANPGHEKTQRFLAQLLSQAVSKNHDEAAKLWADLLQRHPDEIDIGETLAIVYLRARKYDQALKLVRQRRRRAPKDPTLRLLEVDALVQSEQVDQAEALIRTWADQDKTSAAWRMLLLDLYTETERFDDALKLLEEIQRDTPTLLPKEVWASRKILFLCRAGKYAQAEALAKSVGNPLCYAVLTDGLVRAKQTDRLLKALHEALARQTDASKRERLQNNLVYAYLQSDRFDEAIPKIEAWIQKIEQSDPKPADAHRQLSQWRTAALRAQLSAGRLEEAQERIREYLVNDPNNAELHNLRATLLTERGKPGDAIEALERAHTLRPKAPSYRNNLAYSLAEAGVQLKRAEKLVRGALQTEGPQSASADTLAWVYYKQGRLGEAAEVLTSILPGEESGRPGQRPGRGDDDMHPVIWDHAGDVYYRLGWADRAGRYWTRALNGAKAKTVATREIQHIRTNTPAKLQAIKDQMLPPVEPLGKKVESSIQKTLEEYQKRQAFPPAPPQPKKR